jgi:hypothetical protein
VAGRIKRLPKDAKAVSLSLGGGERVILSVIEARRRQRGERRETSSQIVADALWHFLDCVEKVPREDIERLFPSQAQVEDVSNLKRFPKRESS